MQAVRRMAWVRPKPEPADKLESVQWEDEKPSGYPWKNLKALTREKKVRLEIVTVQVCVTKSCRGAVPAWTYPYQA